MKKFVRAIAFILVVAVLLQTQTVDAAKAKTPVQSAYQIQVNRVANCVTVYELLNGNYVPIRSFACSVGKAIDNTPLGTFSTSDYYDWRLMVDNSYAQYAVRFNRGILFHSVPYLAMSPNSLETDQYNLLGTNASLGCVRLCTMDVKWIYDNCPKGTTVIVYDDELNPGPLGKPYMAKMLEGNPISVWDPTDLRPENPWNIIRPSLYLKNDYGDGVLYMPVGTDIQNLKAYIGCRDYLGNPLADTSYQATINGNFNTSVSGVYRVWVTVFDSLGNVDQKEMKLAVCSQ